MGLSNTDDLTRTVYDVFGGAKMSEAVLEAFKTHGPIPPSPDIDILRAATQNATGAAPTFETDINAIESLLSLTGYGYVPVSARSSIADLVQSTNGVHTLFDKVNLMSMLDRAIGTVIGKVEERYQQRREAVGPLAERLFGSLHEHYALSIYALSYEPLATEAIPDANDGFEHTDGEALEFSIKRFLYGGGTRVGFLHGCTRFRLKPDVIDGVSQPAEIVRFIDQPPNGYPWYRAANTQAGDFSPVSCIVTGLRKAEKTRFQPYGTYSYAFERDLMKTPHVLVIGYGGADIYLTHQLLRAKALHGANWRCIYILSEKPVGLDRRRDWELACLLAGHTHGSTIEIARAVEDRAGLQQFQEIVMDIGGLRVDDDAQRQQILETLA